MYGSFGRMYVCRLGSGRKKIPFGITGSTTEAIEAMTSIVRKEVRSARVFKAERNGAGSDGLPRATLLLRRHTLRERQDPPNKNLYSPSESAYLIRPIDDTGSVDSLSWLAYPQRTMASAAPLE